MSEEYAAAGVRVLGRALDQAGDLLDHVHEDVLDRPTPCAEWDVATLADHLVADPTNFLAMMRGEQPDWTAPGPRVTEGWGAQFRNAADDLIHAWHQVDRRGEEVGVPPEFQVAEFAVHAWDLASALGRPTAELDTEVAETALAFLRANLTPEMRGHAFGAEQAAPRGAGPYEELASFAGRTVVGVD